tara:strand:- start:1706 stop:1876 length:171 start_codon:yes stop_codon:yes gene_type:complete
LRCNSPYAFTHQSGHAGGTDGEGGGELGFGEGGTEGGGGDGGIVAGSIAMYRASDL